MSFRKDSDGMLRAFEKYRIASTHTNAAFKIPFEGTYLFLKVYGPKHPRLPYEIRKFLNTMGVRQPVEYRSPLERKIFEEETLRHWESHGYRVPAITDNPFPELSAIPTLTTQFITGVTLREFIGDETITLKEKERRLSDLFHEISLRHHHAFSLNDTRLFHIDANTRNIIFSEDITYHCDFEMGRLWQSPIACASREIMKLLVSIGEDSDLSVRDFFFSHFKEAYEMRDVSDFIKEGASGRSFQAIHRYRNARKKRGNPGKVTPYDILHYLP
jgi:tRNA A-37 threonylcarbamoyl transferase component Bud32